VCKYSTPRLASVPGTGHISCCANGIQGKCVRHQFEIVVSWRNSGQYSPGWIYFRGVCGCILRHGIAPWIETQAQIAFRDLVSSLLLLLGIDSVIHDFDPGIPRPVVRQVGQGR
jgi:hypothetical protein